MKENKLLCSLISFFIILSLAIPVSSTVAFVAPVPPTIEIWDWYDLDAIRDNLGSSYVLMNDLDSTTAGYGELASETANGARGWEPIGTPDDPFIGSFDGQGHEIRDLFINRPDEYCLGLFCYVSSGGVIEDVGVVDADVTGGWLVGGLIAVNGGTVSNSYSTGSVIGAEYSEYVGGLTGGNGGTVSNSYSKATVTGDSYAGGLVGENDGRVSNSYATGSVTGNFHVGGLVGLNYYGMVSNSYATGSVTGGEYVGGLVGGNHDGTVSNSYSTGSVAGDEHVGGLVGLNENAVSRSFWDIETSGQATSDGGTGKTTAEMKSITTFRDWDITTVAFAVTNPSYIWNIVDVETYPFLSWEQPREAPVVQYTLTVSSTAGGSVTTPGEGTFTYDAGTVVSLVATKASGYGFVNWAGDVDTIANVNAATTTITMEGYYEITVRFMAGVVDAKTERVTNQGTVNARDEADTEVEVEGTATVTVAGYDENPGGVPPVASPDQPDWEPLGKYTDVYVPDTTQVTELEIKLYYTDDEAKDFDEESLRLFWWNGTAWVQCSDSGVNTESNYMWAKIRTSTIPSLTDLQGTPWGGYGHPSSAPKPICFIATAAYGTDTAKEIDILREFRDKVLLPKSLGAKLVSLYYKTSPPIANFISQHEVLKTAVRLGFVDPIVKILDWSHDLWSARGSQ